VYCPKCGAEYVAGFSRCSDCDLPLVEAEPHRPLAPHEHRELVTVFASGDSGLMAIAKSLLRSADVPFLVQGELVQDLFGIGRIGGGVNRITGPMEIQVRADDAGDARLILADLLESQ